MKKWIVGFGLMIALLAGSSMASAQVVVAIKPNRPSVVIIKPDQVKRGYIWKEGHWRWDKRKKSYTWVKSRWIKARKGFTWVPGHWQKMPKGWIWVEGHWKRR